VAVGDLVLWDNRVRCIAATRRSGGPSRDALHPIKADLAPCTAAGPMATVASARIGFR
jgi:hypothetical protein